jgi:hypothetical protein
MITLSKTRTSNHLTNEDIEELKKFIAKSSLWFRSKERVLTMHEQAALGHSFKCVVPRILKSLRRVRTDRSGRC